MTTQKKNKSPKGSTYKFNHNHDLKADTAIVYPENADNDIHLYKLPYRMNALEPYISSRTVYHHYSDHHLSYYRKIKEFCQSNTKYAQVPLEQLMHMKTETTSLKNVVVNASLLRNHNFYWHSLTPHGGINSAKRSKLTRDIVATFGSIGSFKKKFMAKAMNIGIGWIWLFRSRNGLKIVRTDYRTSPLASDYKPLFAIDVWEHAYYIDYGNFRYKYVSNILDHLINWEFAEKNYTAIH